MAVICVSSLIRMHTMYDIQGLELRWRHEKWLAKSLWQSIVNINKHCTTHKKGGSNKILRKVCVYWRFGWEQILGGRGHLLESGIYWSKYGMQGENGSSQINWRMKLKDQTVDNFICLVWVIVSIRVINEYGNWFSDTRSHTLCNFSDSSPSHFLVTVLFQLHCKDNELESFQMSSSHFQFWKYWLESWLVTTPWMYMDELGVQPCFAARAK